MSDLHERLTFFLATDALKETRRANRIFTSARFETVAERDSQEPGTELPAAPHLA